jgi:hypothetical protein
VPPGAEILVGGRSTGKVTPAELQLSRSSLKITLKLKGYESYSKTIGAGDAQVKLDVPLKKPTTQTGKGSGKSCDTCLERPD